MIRFPGCSGQALRLTGAALALAVLAGCEDGQAPSFLQPNDKPAETTPTSEAAKSTKLVERDVEAPDVFQLNEAALWDGRPSLGGVWVAHPDVTDPQRVIIRNTSNNKFVIGALFRRERDIPGPRIQASSDAASALGMLAGAPVQLNVTALIRETVDEEPEIVVEDATAELPETSEISETSLDPIEGAAAAIDASEPIPTVIDEEATAIPTVIETEEEPAKKKGFKWPWAKPEPEVVAPVGDVAAATAVAAASTAPDVAAPEPAAAPKPRKSQLDKPYIQIGIFSVEENANRTASQMRNAGIIPTVFEQSANGKPFWRVVVGPSYTSSERSALLEKAKEIGFSDAYYVTN